MKATQGIVRPCGVLTRPCGPLWALVGILVGPDKATTSRSEAGGWPGKLPVSGCLRSARLYTFTFVVGRRHSSLELEGGRCCSCRQTVEWLGGHWLAGIGMLPSVLALAVVAAAWSVSVRPLHCPRACRPQRRASVVAHS